MLSSTCGIAACVGGGAGCCFSAIATTKRNQCTCTYMRSLLPDDSNLWILRSVALPVRNVKISAILTVLSPLRVRSRILQAIEVPLVDSSSSLLWHPRSTFPPARLVCEKRRDTAIGIRDISAELHVRVRKCQWGGRRVVVHLVLVVVAVFSPPWTPFAFHLSHSEGSI